MDGVETKLIWYALADDIFDPVGGFFGLLGGEEKKINIWRRSRCLFDLNLRENGDFALIAEKETALYQTIQPTGMVVGSFAPLLLPSSRTVPLLRTRHVRLAGVEEE